MAIILETLGEPDDFNSRQEKLDMQRAIDSAADVARLVRQEIQRDKVTRLVHHAGRYSVANEIYDFTRDLSAPTTFGREPHPHFNFPHLN